MVISSSDRSRFVNIGLVARWEVIRLGRRQWCLRMHIWNWLPLAWESGSAKPDDLSFYEKDIRQATVNGCIAARKNSK